MNDDNPAETKAKTAADYASEIGQHLNVICIQNLVAKCAAQAVEIDALKKENEKLRADA